MNPMLAILLPLLLLLCVAEAGAGVSHLPSTQSGGEAGTCRWSGAVCDLPEHGGVLKYPVFQVWAFFGYLPWSRFPSYLRFLPFCRCRWSHSKFSEEKKRTNENSFFHS